MSLLAGCGDDEGSAGADRMTGVSWVLASGIDVPGWEQTPPNMLFADGAVSGSSGCNRYHTRYRLEGDRLTIDEPAGTMMACASTTGPWSSSTATMRTSCASPPRRSWAPGPQPP